MGKYEKEARELLNAIGGRENISAVSHCMTRMRFVLTDEKKADIEAIEGIGCVKGTFTQAGQFQVIIGNDVSVFFQDFTACAGIEGVSKEAAKEAAKDNQTWLQKLMSNLGEIFAPIIPALICGGLVLGFRNVTDSIAFFENGTKTLVDISQFWAGVDSFLWLIGEAVFWLAVGIVWSITKKMGTTQILGIVLGLTLVSSQLLNGFDVAATPADQIPKWDFGFAQVDMIGYQGQVIAAMMAGFVLVYLERFFRKICPAVISMIVVPVCSLVPAVFIAHMVVGPIGWTIGNAIGDLVYAGLTSNIRFLFAGLFGFFYAPIRHDGTAPHDQRRGFSAGYDYGRNHALAHDRPQQYRPGFLRAGHECSAEKERAGTTGQCSGPGVLLPGRYGAGTLRRQPEIRFSAGLRYDRIRLRGADFSGIRCAGHQHRRRRTAGHPLHLPQYYLIFPAGDGCGDCDSLRAHADCGPQKTLCPGAGCGGFSGGVNDFRSGGRGRGFCGRSFDFRRRRNGCSG